jgi:hypothetical protein
MPDRYAMREEQPGMWIIYDVFTGQPVMVEDSVLSAIDVREANDMVELLNLQDATRRANQERH